MVGYRAHAVRRQSRIFDLRESTPMISATAFDRLMQLGRRRGVLEIDDIRQALPVDTMTIEDLADIVERLEMAGISVDIDPALLTAHHQKVLLQDVNPAAQPAQQSEGLTTLRGGLSRLKSSIEAARGNASRTCRPKHGQISTSIFVVVAVLTLLLLALVAWFFA